METTLIKNHDPWAETPLLLYPMHSRKWGLHREYRVQVPEGPLIVVPAQFVTDLSSVPRVLWWWAAPHGPYTAAAVVHDWLYASGLYPRRYADNLFYRHMRACGVRRTQARIKYMGVRTGGWVAWRKHRNR